MHEKLGSIREALSVVLAFNDGDGSAEFSLWFERRSEDLYKLVERDTWEWCINNEKFVQTELGDGWCMINSVVSQLACDLLFGAECLLSTINFLCHRFFVLAVTYFPLKVPKGVRRSPRLWWQHAVGEYLTIQRFMACNPLGLA